MTFTLTTKTLAEWDLLGGGLTSAGAFGGVSVGVRFSRGVSGEFLPKFFRASELS